MRTVGTFWTGPRLRDLEHLCIRSWVAQGHKVKFYCYEDVANTPPDVEVCDAHPILDRALIYDRTRELGLYAYHMADIFRLAMLMKTQNVWCDCDYAMIRPLPAFEETLLGREQNGKLCNAILSLPQDHPFMPAVIEGFLGMKMPPWSYAKPRWKKFWKALLFKKFTYHDYPTHQWGRHALEHFVKRGKIKGPIFDYKAFYYPVVYDDFLFASNSTDDIIKDPEVHGFHMFYKPPAAYRSARENSFVGWLKKTYGDTLEPDPNAP